MIQWVSPGQTIEQTLLEIDGQGYKAYQRLRGRYQFPTFELVIDHVQGDPFAAPSRLCLLLPAAQFPLAARDTPLRRTALADFIHRRLYSLAQQIQQRRGSGRSGQLTVAATSQAMLARTAVQVGEAMIELRLGAGLPAFGRRVAGAEAIALLTQDIPQLVQGVQYESLDHPALQRQLETVENADALRQQLAERGLVAFVANGAILPRYSGVDQRPLPEALPFQAPASLEVTLTTPYAGSVSGLGLTAGVTLIVGGGYHGKSTLLRAIEQGIYNHIPGDGREQVVTLSTAVKIRAEDGRSVAGVDISPFISNLPQGLSTQSFSTANASGSTSQAASIVEAVEVGAQLLLIDEDTAATNFMIRDRNMQALISKVQEPITPLIDRVRSLYVDCGISTLLVMGGSGDYFGVADTVIALNSYRPEDVTAQAQAIAQANPRPTEGVTSFGQLSARQLDLSALANQLDRRPPKIKVQETHSVRIGPETIDLRAVEQLIEPGQVKAMAQAMLLVRSSPQAVSLSRWLDDLMRQLQAQGLDGLSPYSMGDLSEFRRFELAAAINRLRSLQGFSPPAA
ncbi:MAG: ABC-ATPase domain-containing protein [Leptolyngbya sp. SIO4C1]|nr:ABC-ATPase domain-containing protein [Leptolyngbya sp. SIO4C1]